MTVKAGVASGEMGSIVDDIDWESRPDCGCTVSQLLRRISAVAYQLNPHHSDHNQPAQRYRVSQIQHREAFRPYNPDVMV
jgi:hypothetical protein